MKLKTLDTTFRAIGIGVEGYEKPNKAQTVNTKNMAARENKVYLDILVNGDKVNNEKVEISKRNSGRKKSNVNRVAGMGGYVLNITIRSKGSSKIIGAAAVPTRALPNAIFSP
jgi:hypothetical protein